MYHLIVIIVIVLLFFLFRKIFRRKKNDQLSVYFVKDRFKKLKEDYED